jgi:hypothetical protein
MQKAYPSVNPDGKERPLTPALSPYEGERENLSLAIEHANGLDSCGSELMGSVS